MSHEDTEAQKRDVEEVLHQLGLDPETSTHIIEVWNKIDRLDPESHDALFERLERKLEAHQGQLLRAAVELAKDWRTDKFLRNLEAMMIVADKDVTLILTGNGDVLEPETGVAAIGSGGNYALAAAKALVDYEADAETIARKAMAIAAEVCVYTNDRLTVEILDAAS